MRKYREYTDGGVMMKDIIKQAKRHWKVLTALAVVLTVSIIGMTMLFANDVVLTMSISEDKMTWELGDTPPELQAVVTSSDNTIASKTISWSSSAEEVVSISNILGADNDTVQLKFNGAGKATITCTTVVTFNDGTTADKKVTRDFFITLKAGSSDFDVLEVGKISQLYTNYSQDGDATGLTWTSSDTGVIELVPVNDSTGRYVVGIKAVGSGTAEITARTSDGQTVKFIRLVKAKFDNTAMVEVKPSEFVSVYEKGEANSPDPTLLTWGTIDTDGTYITVDKMGRVQGNLAGITEVYMYTTYKYGELTEAQYKGITAIVDDPEKLADEFGDSIKVKVLFGIYGGDKVLTVGDTAQLSVNVTESLKSAVNWNSSNTSVVTVDSKGNLTAVSAGTATITAQIVGNKLYETDTQTIHTATINVSVVDNFAVSETEHTLNRGEQFTLKAIPTDTSDGTTISWTSSDESIATITYSESDKYSAIINAGPNTGTAIITAYQTSADGVVKKATCTVYVKEPVSGVQMEPEEVEITVGSEYQLTLIFNNDTGTIPDNLDVKWVSSDESIATVEKSTMVNGLVKAHSGGDVVISAITYDGIVVASCKVHVRVPVTGIKLTKNRVDCSMSLGTYQLSYTLTPEGDGVNQAVTWESSNPDVATVDKNGLVTFVSPGKATIICQTVDTGVDGLNLIDTCEFYINQPVTEVILDYNEHTMKIGDTFRLTALVNPDDATNKTVIWKSSDTSVATVDTTGNITAVGSGSATIICQSEDSGVFDYCNVSVYQPVTSVTLNTHEMTVRKGTIFWLNATVGPDDAWNKTVVWSSSDETVATVDQTGMVTAVAPGECVITATSADSAVVDRCTVVVTEPVDGISLNFTEATVYTGEKIVIIPTVTPVDADNKSVTYLSSDPSVATVDTNGIVTGVSGGSAIILVTTVERGLVASCKVTVYEFVTSVEIQDKTPYINKGVTRRLKAIVRPDTATNTGVVWSSNRPDIISVDSKGNITANGYGTAVITATAADGSGVYDTYTLTSVKPVEKVTVAPSSVTVLEGQSVDINATVTPSDATFNEVDWTSSDDTIASVDFNGTITGKKAGICYVFATSTDGNNIQGKVKVTVKPAVPATSVVINTTEMVLLPGQTEAAQARLKPTKSTDGIEWVSGDPCVATVDQNGVVTAKGQGQTEIYCIADSGVESSFTVIVLALNSSKITVEQYDSYVLDVFGATEKIKWYTNNNRIATVDSSGNVIGRSVGTTTIMARVNGKVLYCRVTVTKIKK